MSRRAVPPGNGERPATGAVDSAELDQLRLLYEHMIVGTLMATGFAVFLAAHLYGTVQAGLLAAWLTLKLGVAIPRVAQAVLFTRRGGAVNAAGWALTTNLLLAADGLVWGLGGMWFTQGSMVEAAVVAASICCVACVATFGLQASFKATSSYVVPMMAFTAIGMLARGAEFGVYSAVGLTAVLLLMLSTGRRTERRMLESFRLRMLAQQLADERAQAGVVLKAASDHKSRFIATISHEIRSPLHGMVGLAGMLEQHIEEPALRRKAALVASSGRHLLTLVGDLLDMSKIEAGTLRLDPKAFDLAAELEELITLYIARAHEAGIHLHTRFAFPAPLRVVGDGARVRQVLDNLVGNAIKFTPRGGSVSLAVSLSGDQRVSFVVADTGPGISKADQERLFRPFEQGSVDPEKARAGAGLGLAIARDLVTFMQGSLVCESEPGRGATFRCVLPLPLAPEPLPLPVAGPALALGERPAPGTALALVVEDDEANAIVTAAALQQGGWAVEVVGDGRAAVARMTAPSGRPQLVLMDCVLPELDGLEATRRIRAWERRSGARRVRIVALTGGAMRQQLAECLQAGMDEVVTKPFSLAELAAAAARDTGEVNGADAANGWATRRRGGAGARSGFGDLDAPVGRQPGAGETSMSG